MSEIIIKKVETKKEMKAFIRFNYELYKDSPYAVPDFLEDTMDTFDREKNPAFEFCDADWFLAYRDGKIVGRVVAIINSRANDTWQTKNVRFGWIDFVDDAEVSRLLIQTVEQWGQERGMTHIVGPMGFTDMDPEGMLVEGFDQVSTMATIYNHPYYPKHLERLGYQKECDWVEFKITVPDAIPEKMVRICEIVKKKYGVRNIKYTSAKKLIADYGEAIFNLINEAYSELYGYSPLTPRQIKHYINMYVPVLRLTDVSLIVDQNDTLVGVGIAIPSLSKALIKSRGKMLPLGWYHLLKALRGKNDVVDLMLVAVKPEYQSRGVNSLLFNDLIPYFQASGYKYAESNPELEVNQKVMSQWQYFETVQHKRRRAFKKAL